MLGCLIWVQNRPYNSRKKKKPKPAMRHEAATTGSWTTNILRFSITGILIFDFRFRFRFLTSNCFSSSCCETGVWFFLAGYGWSAATMHVDPSWKFCRFEVLARWHGGFGWSWHGFQDSTDKDSCSIQQYDNFCHIKYQSFTANLWTIRGMRVDAKEIMGF